MSSSRGAKLIIRPTSTLNQEKNYLSCRKVCWWLLGTWGRVTLQDVVVGCGSPTNVALMDHRSHSTGGSGIFIDNISLLATALPLQRPFTYADSDFG